jgi:short-subunit dehydrogenase
MRPLTYFRTTSKPTGCNFRAVQHARKFVLVTLLFVFVATACSTSKLSQSGQRKVDGKTYVIIGASSGFGKGVAQQLGQYHANVVLAARRTELLEEVATEIRNAGGTALVVTMDISKPEEVQHLADMAIQQYKTIDVWINDAGVGGIGRFWDIPLEDHARLIDVNLKGFIYGSYTAIKQFRTQGYGTLINLGSVDSEIPMAYHSSYSAAKAGIRSLGQSLNQELRLNGDNNIKVVTIEPWATDTPFFRHAANYSGGTPRMASMDNPNKVVNAIIWSSLHPKKELPVGWKARNAYVFHHLFPHFTERTSANINHKYQIQNAPPAPATDGALYQPMPTGKNVDDGVRRRMKQEDRQRKKS